MICGIGLIFGLFGCSFFGQNEEDMVLIQVEERVTTVGDFKRAFEITKTAYPHNALREDAVYKEAQLRLLNHMIEEMIILERADELGIKITKSELEKVVTKIKEDYPKGVFEEMLLENAVTYESWEEGLKIRSIIEKTIEREVKSQIEITPGDISRYYKDKRNKENSIEDGKEIVNKSEALIVKELRREKAEKKYQKWINKLQERYTIEVNNKIWDKIKKI